MARLPGQVCGLCKGLAAPCDYAAAFKKDRTMTLCPIAIVAGCKKCPAFGVCPLKGVIGDAPPPGEKPGASAPAPKAKTRR